MTVRFLLIAAFGLALLTVERVHVLHGAFTERLLTDDDAAPVVLDRRGKNL